ncbi:MAG: porin family protein [Nitrosomonadaceae bacterium]
MKQLILSLALIILINPIYASEHDDSGFYVGLKTGVWEFTEDPIGKFSSSSTGIFGGYKYNRYLAIELDYLSNTRATASNATESSTVESNSYILALRPILPLNDEWELFAKFGVEYYRFHDTITQIDGTSKNITGEKNVYSQGVGIGWNKNNFQVRAEVQGDKEFDFRVYSIGLAYNF